MLADSEKLENDISDKFLINIFMFNFFMKEAVII